MGSITTSVRILISIGGALIPLLFLSGSLTPLGAYLPNIFGSWSQLEELFGSSIGGNSAILPFGAAGITGFAIYTIIERILGAAQRATYSTPQMDPTQIMRTMQNQIPWMNTQGADVPKNLPQDMTKSQFTILQKYREGQKNPKNIAKVL